jgi:hypothetical protein
MLKSCIQSQCEHQQTDIRRYAERRHDSNDVAARPELLAVQSIITDFGKELLVSCPSALASMDTNSLYFVFKDRNIPCCRLNRLINRIPAP